MGTIPGGGNPGNPTVAPLTGQGLEPYLEGAPLGTQPWRPSQGKVWNPTRAEGCKRDKHKLRIC